jgi:DNA repair protein RadC
VLKHKAKSPKGKKTYTIHDLPSEERPRERLQRVGEKNLSQQELLAIIIEKGNHGENALQLAQRLLTEFESLAKLKKATLEQLTKVKGIGPATACKLKASFQLGLLGNQTQPNRNQKLISAEDVFKLTKTEIGDKNREHFLLICLNSRNQMTSKEILFIGSLNSSLSHPREIFKSAIDHQAAAIIICHNHPSGDIEPSKSDLKLTAKLNQVSQLMEIPLIDHVILSPRKYFSFREKGLI